MGTGVLPLTDVNIETIHHAVLDNGNYGKEYMTRELRTGIGLWFQNLQEKVKRNTD